MLLNSFLFCGIFLAIATFFSWDKLVKYFYYLLVALGVLNVLDITYQNLISLERKNTEIITLKEKTKLESLKIRDEKIINEREDK